MNFTSTSAPYFLKNPILSATIGSVAAKIGGMPGVPRMSLLPSAAAGPAPNEAVTAVKVAAMIILRIISSLPTNVIPTERIWRLLSDCGCSTEISQRPRRYVNDCPFQPLRQGRRGRLVRTSQHRAAATLISEQVSHAANWHNADTAGRSLNIRFDFKAA